jgi:hypothetical protein
MRLANDLFRFVILLGLASVPVAAVSVALLARGRWSPIAMAFALGAVCAIPGYMIGVKYFCLAEHAGNLCGLAAVFGTGPLGFSLAALGYAVLTRAFSRNRKEGSSRSR